MEEEADDNRSGPQYAWQHYRGHVVKSHFHVSRPRRGEWRQICIIASGDNLGHEDLPADGIVTGTDDSGAGNWDEDGYGHGTHVAGTIAALINDFGVVGVGSDGNIPLHIVRVFGNNGNWAYSSTLVAALDRCEEAGAKIVNMSLGNSFMSRSEARAFGAAYNTGVLPIAAAGNAGNTRKSYPASYDTVASLPSSTTTPIRSSAVR
jgi:subtilisin family serine protease